MSIDSDEWDNPISRQMDLVDLEELKAKAAMFDEMRSAIHRLVYGILPRNKSESKIQLEARQVLKRAEELE